ncbi:MAG: cyclic nucleotide-binding domain-containing protein [Candidatus Neomarinimicrobiota bacterium]|nr:cyclic nucleotide-binding domain-containing protein [Candidatus Neomarinimicrobiota bacterium]
MKPLWENYFNKKNLDNPVIHALQSVPVFNELTPKQFKEISRLIHKRNYKKGEIIFKKGSLGEGMYLILSGSVVIKDPESGIVFASLTNDNFFGEMALLDEEPRSAQAEATSPSHLIGFFRTDLTSLISRFPEMGNKILLNLSQVLTERLREANKLLMEKPQ